MGNVITPEQRAQILQKIKEYGMSPKDASDEFNVTEKTIRKWIRKKTNNSNSSTMQLARLKKENAFLKEIVINFLLEKESAKKNNKSR